MILSFIHDSTSFDGTNLYPVGPDTVADVCTIGFGDYDVNLHPLNAILNLQINESHPVYGTYSGAEALYHYFMEKIVFKLHGGCTVVKNVFNIRELNSMNMKLRVEMEFTRMLEFFDGHSVEDYLETFTDEERPIVHEMIKERPHLLNKRKTNFLPKMTLTTSNYHCTEKLYREAKKRLDTLSCQSRELCIETLSSLFTREKRIYSIWVITYMIKNELI